MGTDGLNLSLALSWERRAGCPGAVPTLVCHDDDLVVCDAERAADAKAWLEGAMIEGRDAVLNSKGEVDLPVEVEGRMVRSLGEAS